MAETQTLDILSLTPSMKDNVIPAAKPWGRLYSTYLYLDPVDLENETFQLGRSEDCDVIITDAKVPVHRVTSISKRHFVISKESGNLVYLTDLSKNGTFINGNLVGKGKKNILQNDDEIAIGIKGLKVYVFKVLESKEDKYLPMELRQKYQISRTLGIGACGEVKLIFDKLTCQPYAVKKIIKSRNTVSQQNNLNHPDKIKSEIDILQTLRHPCIIAMKEIVETDESVFIVLEFMEAELNDLIASVENLTEDDGKFLFYQMVLAVQYLHRNDITHRDLKPENVLLKKKTSQSIIKLSDFGLSKLLDSENDVMQTICGTPCYVAPEIIDHTVKVYTQQVDVWSLGVILYYMLAQELPFKSSERSVLNKKILSGSFDYNGKIWSDIGDHAKDLIKKMLTVDPEQRITIEGIIKHPWIDEDEMMRQQVEDLLLSELATECLSSEDTDDTQYSPAAKRSRLSDSY